LIFEIPVLLSFISEFFGRITSETRLEYIIGRAIRPNKRSGFYVLRVTPLLSVHSLKVFRVHRERDTKCPQQRIFTGTFTLCLLLDFKLAIIVQEKHRTCQQINVASYVLHVSLRQTCNTRPFFVWVKFPPHPSNVRTKHQGISFLATLATEFIVLTS